MEQEEKSKLLIDREGGLRRVGGDHEIYDELMELFMENSTSQIEQLKEAVKNKEADSIEKVAHSIKGAAANLGVLLVQQSAFELEQIGSGSKLDMADQSLDKLIYELERVKQYMLN